MHGYHREILHVNHFCELESFHFPIKQRWRKARLIAAGCNRVQCIKNYFLVANKYPPSSSLQNFTQMRYRICSFISHWRGLCSAWSMRVAPTKIWLRHVDNVTILHMVLILKQKNLFHNYILSLIQTLSWIINHNCDHLRYLMYM